MTLTKLTQLHLPCIKERYEGQKAMFAYDDAALLAFKAFQASLSSREHALESSKATRNLVKEQNQLESKVQNLEKALETEKKDVAGLKASLAEKDFKILDCSGYYSLLARVELFEEMAADKNFTLDAAKECAEFDALFKDKPALDQGIVVGEDHEETSSVLKNPAEANVGDNMVIE